MKHVFNSSVMNPHMKREQDGDIFSNVTRHKWCAEVIFVKVDVKGFYSKMLHIIFVREMCHILWSENKNVGLH